MQEEEFNFVTIDTDDSVWTDAVVIDMDGADELWGAVTIDDTIDGSDFIMISDDTAMLSDADMLDINTTDMDIDCTDISFVL